MAEDLGLGQLIGEGVERHRDAVHIAVAPVVAGESLRPGERVSFDSNGEAVGDEAFSIGIVDPFLADRVVVKGQRFWLYLYPGSITSLRHDWTHPAFRDGGEVPAASGSAAKAGAPAIKMSADLLASEAEERAKSEAWMRSWVNRYMLQDYFDEDDDFVANDADRDTVYRFALKAGETHSMGRCIEACEQVDDEWWGHWERLTGKTAKGSKRSRGFVCGC